VNAERRILRRVLVIGLLLVSPAGCSKPSADQLFAKGNEYFKDGLVAEAIVQYRLAVQADPKRGDVRAKLSEAHLKNRDGSAALKEAVTAADLLPNDAAAQIRAGNLLLMARSFQDAKGRGEMALALDAKNVEALVLVGNALAGLKDLDGAITEYQEALALNPSADQVYVNIGAIQYTRGQTKEAEATFRKAVEVAPNSVAARMALASFLWASSQLQDAEKVLKEALVLDPGNLTANRALGAFYMATGRAAEAESYFKTIANATKTEAAQISLADYYLAVRRPDEAKAILTPLTQSKESFGPASLRLAAIEAEKNNRAAATTIVDAVLARTPKYGPARVFKMRLLVVDNKLDEALAAANALIKDEPNSSGAAEAYSVIGGIDASRDRTDEALKAYAESLRIQPQAIGTALALAQLNLRAGNPDKAETFAQQVLAVRPKDLAARAMLVRADVMRNNLTRAADSLASLEKDYPNTVPVLNLLAVRDLAAGQLEKARAAFSKAATLAPDSLEALDGLVILDLRSGRKQEVIERVEGALKRMPPTADLFVIAAKAHAGAGNLARSEELLKQAIEREPARLAAYGLLGQLYIRQQRLPEARDQFRAILARNPRSVPANTMLGMLLEAQPDLAAAEEQYQKTLEVDPTAAVAANNLAWIYVASNRNLDQALQLAQTALKTLPEEPHVNDTIGWIYYRKGLFGPAVRHLELSVKRDPSDPSSHYHLGMAYAQAGDRVKARTALEKALSMSSTFDGAAEAKKALADLPRRNNEP
jgi:tetratricopeptide (TPR) repeat protein